VAAKRSGLTQVLGPAKAMQSRAQTVIAYANFLLAAAIGAWSLYLLTMPLHPAAGDSHGGLLAAFSGLFLAPIALIAFATGRLFQRQSKVAWLIQAITLVLAVTLILALVYGASVA